MGLSGSPRTHRARGRPHQTAFSINYTLARVVAGQSHTEWSVTSTRELPALRPISNADKLLQRGHVSHRWAPSPPLPFAVQGCLRGRSFLPCTESPGWRGGGELRPIGLYRGLFRVRGQVTSRCCSEVAERTRRSSMLSGVNAARLWWTRSGAKPSRPFKTSRNVVRWKSMHSCWVQASTL